MTKIIVGNSIAPTMRSYFKARTENRTDITLLPSSLGKFSSGQAFSEFLGDVEGQPVIFLQSLGSVDNHTTNDFAMQTIQAVAELKNAGASSVWVIAPYSGYPRQDRGYKGTNMSIGIETLGQCLKAVGANGFSTMDMHSSAGIDLLVKHLGEDNVFNLSTTSIFEQHAKDTIGIDALLVGGPDEGADQRRDDLAEALGTEKFEIRKKRDGLDDSHVTDFAGEVSGKRTLTVDDEIDSANTITNAQNTLKDEGATERHIAGTHAVLSKGGLEKAFTAGSRGDRLIKTIAVTDSIDPTFEIARLSRQYSDIDDMSRIYVLEAGPLLWDHIQDDVITHPDMQISEL